MENLATKCKIQCLRYNVNICLKILLNNFLYILCEEMFVLLKCWMIKTFGMSYKFSAKNISLPC